MSASSPTATPVPEGGRSFQTAAPRTSLVVASAIAGLLLGALCGIGLATLRPGTVEARALISVQPDPPVLSGGTGPVSDAQVSAFLQTETIYLNGPEFRALVQETVRGAEPEITATRLQESTVIELLSEARSPQAAVDIANSASQLYVGQRVTRVTARIDQRAAVVRDQLVRAQADFDALAAQDASSSAVQRDAAAARYTQLLELSEQLAVARVDAAAAATPLQGGYVEPRGGLSPTVAGALGGGTLGVLLTVGTVVVARRFSRRIGGPEDLSRYAAPVISPEVPYRRVRPSDVAPAAVASVVATHAPRLAGGRAANAALVLVGPCGGVGTSYLALQHALYSARRDPTLLVRASGSDDALLADALGIDPRRASLDHLADSRIGTAQLGPLVQETRQQGLWVLSHRADDDGALGALERALDHGLVEAALAMEWRVVVDAPALDRSTAGLVAARHCGATVLVVASGRTRREEVERALDTFASWGVALTGVVTNRAPRSSRGRRQQPPPSSRRSSQPMRPRTT